MCRKSAGDLQASTHDWEVWVKNLNDDKIEKVVFNLHELFPNSKRMVNNPPFVIKESGYGSFMMHVDVATSTSGRPRTGWITN